MHISSAHMPLSQSMLSLHLSPSRQASQLPPQSTSVSSWFFTPSSQLPFAHFPSEQYPLEQSSVISQLSFSKHFLAQLPPQSTSVSSPSFTSFLQACSAFRLMSTLTPSLSFVSLHSPALFRALTLKTYSLPSCSSRSLAVTSSDVVVLQFTTVMLPEIIE